MSKQHHRLKTLPHFFKQSWDGDKHFEIRDTSDRQFQCGDSVTLVEFIPPRAALMGRETGREITGRISFVTTYEQKEGYVVFALADMVNHDLRGLINLINSMTLSFKRR